MDEARRAGIWANVPLGIKGLIVVALPVGCLIVAVVLSFYFVREPLSEELFVARYLQRVHSDVQAIGNQMAGAEAGVRDYLLTGDKQTFLRRLWVAERRLPALLTRIEEDKRDFTASDLGFGVGAASGAGDRLLELPGLSEIDDQLSEIERLVPQRSAALRELVEYGKVTFNVDPTDDPPPIDLRSIFADRADLIKAVNRVLKPIQPQLLALPREASDQQQQRREDQLEIIVVIAALGLVGGLLSALLFSWTIGRRIGRLERGAQGLAHGEPVSDLPRGRDAIGRLGEELQGASVLLANRERGLREAKEEADRANHAKSEFLSRMSHELRTPLNAILGFGQLLQMDGLRAEQRQSVDQIVKAGRHLLELINEVLDMARVEAGELALSIEPVAVDQIVQETVALVAPLGRDRDVTFDVEAVPAHVMADRQRLKQVLLNLLSNAVKFNRDGGRASVTVRPSSKGTVVIAISDMGPGIAPADVARLFVPFDRLGADREGVSGTGLGLALSKSLIEAMHGSISVESRPGKGSRFAIELPQATDPARATLPAATEASEDEPALAGPTRTILYIEDNVSNLKLVESILERRPTFTLMSALQGRLGLALAEQHRPDLVLLDLNLPDIRGQDVLAMLRRNERTRDIPVIIVSADATRGQARRLLDRGASAYVTKPLEVKPFLELVDAALADAARR